MTSSMRTPLGKVRGHGASQTGTSDFIGQRASAVLLALLAPYLVITAALSLDGSYAAAREWVAQWYIAPALALALFAALYHMQLGMQVVIEDYIAKPLTRTVLALLNMFAALAAAAGGGFAILKIFLGA